MPFLDSLTAVLLLLFVRVLFVQASVHDYSGVKFAKKGNAYVVHGGSEGIYYSHPNLNHSEASSNGDAYIRSVYSVYHLTVFCNYLLLL